MNPTSMKNRDTKPIVKQIDKLISEHREYFASWRESRTAASSTKNLTPTSKDAKSVKGAER